MMFNIAKKISYQFYDDFCVILNHADGNDYRLNSSGAEIFRKTTDNSSSFSAEELEFIEDLISAGIVFRDDEIIETMDMDFPQNGGINSSIWNELTEFASQNIIPVSAILELTYRCPVNCVHCYIDRSSVTSENELSFEKYAEFIDDFRSLGGLYLVLTGGDPLLHKDFEKIFNYARKKHIAVSIMSSGVNSDPNLLERISRLGIMSFQASIHGHNSEIHDKFAGVPGSFEKTLATLRFLKKRGVFIQVAVIINRQNIEFFDEIINLLENEKINYVFNFEMFQKRNGDPFPVSLNISEDQLKSCLQKTGNLGKPRLADKKPEDPQCNAARSLFSINPAGTVFPCLELRIPAGSIKDSTLGEIWNKSKVLNEIRNIKFKDLTDCPTCEFKNFCNRCPGAATREGLKITEHSSTDCAFAKTTSQFF